MLNKMNLLGRLLIAGLFGLLMMSAAVKAQPSSSYSSAPSAKHERTWVEYDVTENDVKGMRIHNKFTVYGMKNLPSYLAIYFEDGNGKRLPDSNKKFYSTNGEVAIYKELSIGYDPGVFNDVAVFMPYSEFDITAGGKYTLTMDIKLIYKAGGLIQQMTTYPFEYTKPNPVTAPTTSNSETQITKVWMDYDVTENGRRGMMIHVAFKVYGLKDVASYLAIYVADEKGDRFKSSNNEFSSVDGELALFKTLKPGYELSVYDDSKLFLPYDEIPVGNGEHNLKLDIDVIRQNGDLVKHLDFKPFVFTRKR